MICLLLQITVTISLLHCVIFWSPKVGPYPKADSGLRQPQIPIGAGSPRPAGRPVVGDRWPVIVASGRAGMPILANSVCGIFYYLYTGVVNVILSPPRCFYTLHSHSHLLQLKLFTISPLCLHSISCNYIQTTLVHCPYPLSYLRICNRLPSA